MLISDKIKQNASKFNTSLNENKAHPSSKLVVISNLTSMAFGLDTLKLHTRIHITIRHDLPICLYPIAFNIKLNWRKTQDWQKGKYSFSCFSKNRLFTSIKFNSFISFIVSLFYIHNNKKNIYLKLILKYAPIVWRHLDKT